MEVKVHYNPPSNGDVLPKTNETNSYFDISHRSRNVQFFICCFGVFVFYLIYGYLQELIFTLDGFKPYGWYLTLVQFGYYSVFGLAESRLNKAPPRKIPYRTYLLLALLTLGTMGLSNASLGLLNYPTQVMFKCCKLIPVMIGSILIQRKRYTGIDFLAAGLMCVGLTAFTLADAQAATSSSSPTPVAGIVMISAALVCDAVIGNVQEKSMRQHKGSNTEVVLYSYSIGFAYLFVAMLLSGELVNGALFCWRHPLETYGYAFLFSVSGYLGIQVVLTLVQTHGALVAVTVTTCRKAVTIVISFIFFQKPFTLQYVWSALLVVLGIYLNIYSKNRSKMNFNSYLNAIKGLMNWQQSKYKLTMNV